MDGHIGIKCCSRGPHTLITNFEIVIIKCINNHIFILKTMYIVIVSI